MYHLCISDLPNELIAKIFNAGTRSWCDDRLRGLPFPLLVSSICKHWRYLAENTPELWTFIIPPLHKDEEFCLFNTSLWLSRSKGMMLSVVIDSRRCSPHLSRQEMSSLVSAALRSIVDEANDRLRRLDIYDHCSDIRIYPPSLYVAPHLRQLSLCFINTGFSSFGEADAENLSVTSPFSLPNLTRFRLLGLRIPYMSNLTNLIVINLRISYHEAQILFSTSPNLSSLTLDNPFPIFPPPVEAESLLINAHSLQRIALRAEGQVTGVVNIIKLLSIPNLNYLELDGVGATAVSYLFAPSFVGTNIRTLRIKCSQTYFMSARGKDDNIRILQSFPLLQVLHISHGPTDALLSRIISGPSRTRTRSISLAKPTLPTLDLSNRLPQEAASFLRKKTTENNHLGVQESKKVMPWPELHTIRLDTLLATDVATLCKFIFEHKGVKNVQLSISAMRHLSGSLRRRGNDVVFAPSPMWRPREADQTGTSNEGTKDVQEWLTNIVELSPLLSADCGLLDGYGLDISLSEII